MGSTSYLSSTRIKPRWTERRRVAAVLGTELLADQLEVMLYRPLGQVHGAGYLLGFPPGGEEAQNLDLPLR